MSGDEHQPPPPKVSASDLDCFTRVCNASVAMFGIGSIIGAVKAAWAEAPLTIQRGQTLAAVRNTGSYMANSGGVFAAVGAMYTGTSCLSKSIRGKDDFWAASLAGWRPGRLWG